MKEMCTGEVDRWQGAGAAIFVFSNWRNLWCLPRSEEVVLGRELGHGMKIIGMLGFQRH